MIVTTVLRHWGVVHGVVQPVRIGAGACRRPAGALTSMVNGPAPMVTWLAPFHKLSPFFRDGGPAPSSRRLRPCRVVSSRAAGEPLAHNGFRVEYWRPHAPYEVDSG